MVGRTLVEIRERVKALAAEEGDYTLVCARTGTHPIPAAGKRFDSRERASLAAEATEQYRAALRRYDPRVPVYDIIVTEAATGADDEVAGPDWQARTVGGARDSDPKDGREGDSHPYESLSKPVLDGANPGRDREARVAFCHRLAAAVFEALSAGGHDAIETAVMDTYMALAEQVDSPDGLCLRLLEAMASELHEGLEAGAQAAVIDAAATRLGRDRTAADPLSTTLTRLRRADVLGGFRVTGVDATGEGPTARVAVVLDGYAFAPRDGRLPLLPLVLEGYRWQHTGHLTVDAVAPSAAGWQLQLGAGAERPTGCLATAPIQEEV